MAATFTCFRPNPILSTNHRKADRIRRNASNPSSSNWWTPLFGWSSDPDYIDKSATDDVIDPTDSETGRTRSRFAPGCFTEEKAKQLRKKTTEAKTFHDIMYHSAIASRLASDMSDR